MQPSEMTEMLDRLIEQLDESLSVARRLHLREAQFLLAMTRMSLLAKRHGINDGELRAFSRALERAVRRHIGPRGKPPRPRK